MQSPDELDELGNTAVTRAGALDLDDDDDEDPRPGHLQMVVIGSGTFATHALRDSGVVTIGRSNRSDITINEVSISRRHAILGSARR